MSDFLEFREKLKELYIKNEMYIMPVLKFILAIVLLLLINMKMGHMEILGNPVFMCAVALTCAFLPTNTTVVVCSLYVIANGYALSMEVAIVAVVLVLLMFLLYFRFAPKDAFIVLLVPIAFACKMPYVVPLLIGMLATPMSIVSMGFGIIMYYFVTYISENAGVLSATGNTDVISKVSMILENVMSYKVMLLMLISFMATVVVVYLVRRLNIDHVWTTATIVGVLTNLLIMLVGEFMMNITGNIGSMLIFMLISGVLVYVIQFFVFSLDYTRAEYVQFEDDEYYYYVKAVPKMTVSASSKKVQRINPQKR